MKNIKLVKSYKKHRQHKRKVPLFNLLPLELLLITLISGGSISVALMGSRHNTTTPYQTSSSHALTQAATIKPNATPPTQSSTKTTNCSQVETAQANKYYGVLATDWGIWSKSTYLTPAEINYEYNQGVEQTFNDGYAPSMRDAGCTPIPSLLSSSLKTPATAPDFNINTSTPTYTPTAPAVPTCDTTLEAEYQNSYNQQYASYQQQEQQQIQNLQIQLGIAGAGDSSALQQGEYAIGQQFNNNVDNLKQQTNDELVNVHCPTM